MSLPLNRWYIDTRPFQTSDPTTKTLPINLLPLLNTLRPTDSASIQRYYQLPDRLMHLASCLLKYLYIHRTLRIPWRNITISATPAPHKRPCYVPEHGQPAVEFNISHQAGLTALVGCQIPTNAPKPDQQSEIRPGQHGADEGPRLGVDITCVNEASRKQTQINTVKELEEWVDIFKEVFSAAEVESIKGPLGSSSSLASSTTDTLEPEIKAKLRRFYAYWALKEAYIKMTGEALLADWLRELEFRNVKAPEEGGDGDEEDKKWGSEEVFDGVWLKGKKVEDVRMSLVGFEEGFILATAGRGLENGAASTEEDWPRFVRIDIERDIAPCARGQCSCL